MHNTENSLESRYLVLKNSLISGSPSGGDCFNVGDDLVDQGYNIVEDGSCITATTSLAADPKLDPLQDNGGETETQALLEGSPAIDAVPAALCAVSEDQRGVSRPQGEACDIGAFEAAPASSSTLDVLLPLVVYNFTD